MSAYEGGEHDGRECTHEPHGQEHRQHDGAPQLTLHRPAFDSSDNPLDARCYA